jgi:hypothetical protein
MIIPFDKIPKESRVWIYQSNRKFTEKEITEITNKLKNFLKIGLLTAPIYFVHSL